MKRVGGGEGWKKGREGGLTYQSVPNVILNIQHRIRGILLEQLHGLVWPVSFVRQGKIPRLVVEALTILQKRIRSPESLSETTPLLVEAFWLWMDTHWTQARLVTLLKWLRKKDNLVRCSGHVGASGWKLVKRTEPRVEAKSPGYAFCSWSS